MTTLPLDGNQDALRKVLAFGAPVLVLGPGCQRISYDAEGNPAWSEVVRRMRMLYAQVGVEQQQRFLYDYWLSKVSEETQARVLAGITDDHYRLSVAPGTADAELIDRVRLALAVPLLEALINCTTCLGEVIRSGEAPVLSWHRVSHDPTAADGGVGSNEARQRAIKAMSAFCEQAAALKAWKAGDGGRDYHEELERLGLRGDGRHDDSEQVGRLVATLRALNIDAISYNADAFRTRCLGAVGVRQGDCRLSGAAIEWLGDLFWHVIVGDSAVLPSQSELAFYVNLPFYASLRRDQLPREHSFTRPRPGEYRSDQASARMRSSALSEAVNLRLARCPNGLEEAGRWDFERNHRLGTARSMAATLLTQWQAYTDERARAPLPVALVSGYDLTLERQLLELAREGDTFHAIVPVWVSAGPSESVGDPAPRLDWLIGTYTRWPGDFAPTHLTTHEGRRLRWDWYQPDTADDSRDFEGPVVVKLNGSPLLDIGQNPTGADLGLETRPPRPDETLELATIFSEYDSLAAIMTFSKENGLGLAGKLFNRLSWDQRSWLFLGDSFPDWIPRLRLLYNARLTLERQTTGEFGLNGGALEAAGARSTAKVAIDRSFDWPEEAMLAALSVTAYQGDLAWFAHHASQLPESDVDSAGVPRADQRQVDGYFEAVNSVMERTP